MNKILAAGLIAATTALSANATHCGNGGFYMGAAIGASFNKASFKFDRASLNDNLDSGIKGLTEKVVAKQAAADKLFEDVDVTDFMTQLETFSTQIANTLGAKLTSTVAPADTAKGVEESSIAAYYYKKSNSTDAFYKFISWVVKYNPEALSDTTMSQKLTSATDISVVIAEAAQAAIKLGEINTLGAALGLTGTQKELTFVSVKIQGDKLFADNKTGAYYDLFKSDSSSKYVPYKTALDSVATTMNNLKKAADADGKDASESVIKLFYTDTDRKTANTTAQFVEALSKYSTGIIDKELTELKVNSKDVASKKATGFLFAANFGFDHRINDVMLGIELEAGMEAGGKVKKKDLNKTDGLTVRRQFYVSLMPRVGYLFTPQFEGFLTFGGSLGKYKTDTSLWDKVFNHAGAVVEMNKQWNKDNPKDLLDTKVNNTEAANIYKKHSKTKFVPVIGAGVRYEITPEIFATLAYNYAFKTTVASQAKAGTQVKFQSHILKAGVGFRF